MYLSSSCGLYVVWISFRTSVRLFSETSISDGGWLFDLEIVALGANVFTGVGKNSTLGNISSSLSPSSKSMKFLQKRFYIFLLTHNNSNFLKNQEDIIFVLASLLFPKQQKIPKWCNNFVIPFYFDIANNYVDITNNS